MKTRPVAILAVLIGVGVVCLSAYFAYNHGRNLWVPVYHKIVGKQTVQDVLETYGPDARHRLSRRFEQAGVAYPPRRLTLLAVKIESVLEVWAETNDGPRYVREYPIHALSGLSGPKLREGDHQVPEGHYRIVGLNPNSAFHLSMKLNYPKAFDLEHAAAEGRTRPGSNIFIHGRDVSVGCLAMGDPAIEELFTLTADVGKDQVRLVIAPTDPRKRPLETSQHVSWVSELYGTLNETFSRYPRPKG